MPKLQRVFSKVSKYNENCRRTHECGFWIRDKKTGVAAFRCGDVVNNKKVLCPRCEVKEE